MSTIVQYNVRKSGIKVSTPTLLGYNGISVLIHNLTLNLLERTYNVIQ